MPCYWEMVLPSKQVAFILFTRDVWQGLPQLKKSSTQKRRSCHAWVSSQYFAPYIGGSFKTLVCWELILICLNGKGVGASGIYARPDDDFSPPAPPAFSGAHRRTRPVERLGPAVLRGHFTRRCEGCGNGCPPCPRTWLAHAFIAKHVYQLFPTTRVLLDALPSRPLLRQLCGWESAGEIPSEPTFSRAFAQFAQDQLPQQIHEQRVKAHAGPKLVGPPANFPCPAPARAFSKRF